MRAAYTITIFAGALLLFLVQPMIGKRVLPLLGGSPAVWNTCMVFFQVALLCGYVYAHLLAKLRGARRQVLVHSLVLGAALFALPIALRGEAPAGGASPVLWLVTALVVSVGLPFFAVSASAPLLQRWFSGTGHSLARDPYFLYAASTAGSLAGLLCYPLLVEPALPLRVQQLAWSGGYLAFAAGAVSCGVLLVRRPGPALAEAPGAADPARSPGPCDYLRWTVLALAPSSLMLGVTQHITTDVGAVPLLWVVPLCIYLLTYILAFSRRRLVTANVASWLLVPLAIGALWAPRHWWDLPISLILGLHLVLLFVASAACHGRLADSRPPPRFLTGYYLAIAAGGALGGAFNALLAPVVFESVVEYPLMIAFAVLLRARPAFGDFPPAVGRTLNLAVDAAVVVLALLFHPLRSTWPGVEIALTERTFFGVHWVALDDDSGLVGYCQGSTVHGFQSVHDRGRPLGYYHEETGIARIFEELGPDPRLDRVGLIGLGTGTMGAYARPGAHYTFFEIDPAVVEIARDERYFTYLRDMAEPPEIVLGDGRLGLAAEPDGEFGLIVLDAFTSDAVPVHLLTAEAIDLYFRKLQPDGLLAAHLTNRHVDLPTVIAGIAADRGLHAWEWVGGADVDSGGGDGRFPTRWFVLSRDDSAAAPLLDDPQWVRVPRIEGAPVWTDDFSNLVSLLKWWRE